jgi:5'-nucleotidase
VNFPPGKGWPVVATRLGTRRYDDIVEFRVDPRGREYLWIGGGGWHHSHVPGSDTEAYDRGAVSITPLLLDLTASGGADLARHLATAAST